ncbi:hypothetical protein [Carboxylicivirga taeanensis]|uniref:hypothetical protein n=1 Tax=Carboxylicivirga taeanensis TaxID=1416875 RepID=UPI003F6E0FB2
MAIFAAFSNGDIREYENKESALKANAQFIFWITLKKNENNKKIYNVEFIQNEQSDTLTFGSWKFKNITIENPLIGSDFYLIGFQLIDIAGEVRSYYSETQLFSKIFDETAYDCKSSYRIIISIGPLIAIANQIQAFHTWNELELKYELINKDDQIKKLKEQIDKLSKKED